MSQFLHYIQQQCNGAKVCELLGIYILSLLGKTHYKNNVRLCGDDSFKVFKNIKNIWTGIYMLLLLGETHDITQPAITYSKLTLETPEQGVKYVQS